MTDAKGGIPADGGIPLDLRERKMSPATQKLLEKMGGNVPAGDRVRRKMEGGVPVNPEKREG